MRTKEPKAIRTADRGLLLGRWCWLKGLERSSEMVEVFKEASFSFHQHWSMASNRLSMLVDGFEEVEQGCRQWPVMKKENVKELNREKTFRGMF
ncbi:hypothetical protein U1Q18_022629 [Sarracenia purpurea var. burkii]